MTAPEPTVDSGPTGAPDLMAALKASLEHAREQRTPEPEPAVDSGGRIYAPWTAEQVEALNRWQASGVWHPFTCPDGHGPLMATPTGWTCMCAYTQGWAHAFMAQPAAEPTADGAPPAELVEVLTQSDHEAIPDCRGPFAECRFVEEHRRSARAAIAALAEHGYGDVRGMRDYAMSQMRNATEDRRAAAAAAEREERARDVAQAAALERNTLRAQLAEVTRERDEAAAEAAAGLADQRSNFSAARRVVDELQSEVVAIGRERDDARIALTTFRRHFDGLVGSGNALADEVERARPVVEAAWRWRLSYTNVIDDRNRHMFHPRELALIGAVDALPRDPDCGCPVGLGHTCGRMEPDGPTASASGGCVLPAGQPHRYTSTACLHGEHDYCSGTTRQDGGSKTPAQCKFCRAKCLCICHQTGRLHPTCTCAWNNGYLRKPWQQHRPGCPAGPLSEPVAAEQAEDGEQGATTAEDATGAEISSWVSPVHTTGTGSEAEGWERLRATTRLIAESEDRAAERARTGRLATTEHVRRPSRDTAYIGPDADEDEPSAEAVEDLESTPDSSSLAAETGLDAAIKTADRAAFPGLPRGMSAEEARRRVTKAVQAAAPLIERAALERAADEVPKWPIDDWYAVRDWLRARAAALTTEEGDRG
jgi:hypothetical protein